MSALGNARDERQQGEPDTGGPAESHVAKNILAHTLLPPPARSAGGLTTSGPGRNMKPRAASSIHSRALAVWRGTCLALPHMSILFCRSLVLAAAASCAIAHEAAAQADTTSVPCDGRVVSSIDIRPGRPSFSGQSSRWRSFAR